MSGDTRIISLTIEQNDARRFFSHREVMAAAEFVLSKEHDYTIDHHPLGGYIMKVNHYDRPMEYLGYYKGIVKE